MWSKLFLLAAAVEACLRPSAQDTPKTRKVRRQEGEVAAPPSWVLMPVGDGDRWESGKKAPRGLGTQPDGIIISTMMNIQEMRSAVDALANEFGIRVVEAPEKTWENRTMYAAVVSNGPIDDVRTFFTGQMHGRERGLADSIIYFLADLLLANREGTGLAYNGAKFSHAQVKKALGAGIAFMPNANPDGIQHDRQTNECWRGNRNPTASKGVDLNRDFDWLWDFEKKFAPSIDGSLASTNPETGTYHGTKPFSEPGARNMRWVFDELATNVNFHMDVHGFGSDYYLGVGDDLLQHDDPEMNFMNSTYDGKRGYRVDYGEYQYREYWPVDAWKTELFIASQTCSTMNAVYNYTYGKAMRAVTAVADYATSGDIQSWAISRHLVDPSKSPVHSFTLEMVEPAKFDESDDGCWAFYPNEENYNMILRVGGAGYMQFLLAAADEGFTAHFGKSWVGNEE